MNRDTPIHVKPTKLHARGDKNKDMDSRYNQSCGQHMSFWQVIAAQRAYIHIHIHIHVHNIYIYNLHIHVHPHMYILKTPEASCGLLTLYFMGHVPFKTNGHLGSRYLYTYCTHTHVTYIYIQYRYRHMHQEKCNHTYMCIHNIYIYICIYTIYMYTYIYM